MTLRDRRRALMGMKKPRLPAEYQEVAWIESTGTQYINTGIYPAANSVLTLTATRTDASSGNTCGIGYITSGKKNYSRVLFSLRSDINIVVQLGIGAGNDNAGYAVVRETIDSNPHTIVLDIANGYGSCDGGTPVSFVNPGYQAQSAVALPLFGMFSNTAVNPYKMRISYFRYDAGGVTIHEYYPCYRKADGVIGMYDITTNTFHANAGTGTFVKGANV